MIKAAVFFTLFSTFSKKAWNPHFVTSMAHLVPPGEMYFWAGPKIALLGPVGVGWGVSTHSPTPLGPPHPKWNSARTPIIG